MMLRTACFGEYCHLQVGGGITAEQINCCNKELSNLHCSIKLLGYSNQSMRLAGQAASNVDRRNTGKVSGGKM